MTDIQEHLEGVPDVCVVAFASGGGDFGGDLSHFEFQASLAKIGVPHVLLRDTTERWYQQGVQGLGTRDVVVHYIRALKQRYRKVITVGVSSGAYGALLYGQLSAMSGGPSAGADEIIAISPLTVLGKPAEWEFSGTRPDLIHRIKLPADYPLTIDLKPWFVLGSLPRMRGFISDGDGTELDQQMFQRLLVKGGLSRVHHEGGGWDDVYVDGHTLTMIPGYTHAQLGRGMRDRGLFDQLFGGK